MGRCFVNKSLSPPHSNQPARKCLSNSLWEESNSFALGTTNARAALRGPPPRLVRRRKRERRSERRHYCLSTGGRLHFRIAPEGHPFKCQSPPFHFTIFSYCQTKGGGGRVPKDLSVKYDLLFSVRMRLKSCPLDVVRNIPIVQWGPLARAEPH